MKKLPPKKTFYRILIAILVLLVIHISSYLYLMMTNGDPESFLFRKLNFNEERNLPSLFSTILHLSASYLLAVIALSKLRIKNIKWFWGTLSIMFLFLGLDEMFTFHERFSNNIYDLEGDAVFFYNWVIVYIAILLVLAIIFFKPIFSLPKKTLMRFILAGIVFVLGAVVLETIAANIVFKENLSNEEHSINPLVMGLATFEELLEMLGVALFIYALLDFIKTYRIPQTTEENISK